MDIIKGALTYRDKTAEQVRFRIDRGRGFWRYVYVYFMFIV